LLEHAADSGKFTAKYLAGACTLTLENLLSCTWLENAFYIEEFAVLYLAAWSMTLTLKNLLSCTWLENAFYIAEFAVLYLAGAFT